MAEPSSEQNENINPSSEMTGNTHDSPVVQVNTAIHEDMPSPINPSPASQDTNTGSPSDHYQFIDVPEAQPSWKFPKNSQLENRRKLMVTEALTRWRPFRQANTPLPKPSPPSRSQLRHYASILLMVESALKASIKASDLERLQDGDQSVLVLIDPSEFKVLRGSFSYLLSQISMEAQVELVKICDVPEFPIVVSQRTLVPFRDFSLAATLYMEDVETFLSYHSTVYLAENSTEVPPKQRRRRLTGVSDSSRANTTDLPTVHEYLPLSGYPSMRDLPPHMSRPMTAMVSAPANKAAKRQRPSEDFPQSRRLSQLFEEPTFEHETDNQKEYMSLGDELDSAISALNKAPAVQTPYSQRPSSAASLSTSFPPSPSSHVKEVNRPTASYSRKLNEPTASYTKVLNEPTASYAVRSSPPIQLPSSVKNFDHYPGSTLLRNLTTAGLEHSSVKSHPSSKPVFNNSNVMKNKPFIQNLNAHSIATEMSARPPNFNSNWTDEYEEDEDDDLTGHNPPPPHPPFTRNYPDPDDSSSSSSSSSSSDSSDGDVPRPNYHSGGRGIADRRPTFVNEHRLRIKEPSPSARMASMSAHTPQFDHKLKQDIVPEWDGDPDTMMRFIQKVNLIAERGKVVYKQLGSIVPLRFKDGAANWFYGLSSRRRKKVTKNWGNLRKAMRKHFMHRAWKDRQKKRAFAARFRDHTAPNESPSEYFYRKLDLLETVADWTDSQLISEIMEGAPDFWAQIIDTQRMEDREDLQDAIAYHEERLANGNRLHSKDERKLERLQEQVNSILNKMNRDHRPPFKPSSNVRANNIATKPGRPTPRPVGSHPSIVPKFPKDDANVTKKGRTPAMAGARSCRHCGSGMHWDNECRYAKKGNRLVRANAVNVTDEYLAAMDEYEELYYSASSSETEGEDENAENEDSESENEEPFFQSPRV